MFRAAGVTCRCLSLRERFLGKNIFFHAANGDFALASARVTRETLNLNHAPFCHSLWSKPVRRAPLLRTESSWVVESHSKNSQILMA
jgi:hypothetical protein